MQIFILFLLEVLPPCPFWDSETKLGSSISLPLWIVETFYNKSFEKSWGDYHHVHTSVMKGKFSYWDSTNLKNWKVPFPVFPKSEISLVVYSFFMSYRTAHICIRLQSSLMTSFGFPWQVLWQNFLVLRESHKWPKHLSYSNYYN